MTAINRILQTGFKKSYFKSTEETKYIKTWKLKRMGRIKIGQSDVNKMQATRAILMWNQLEFRAKTTKWMRLISI